QAQHLPGLDVDAAAAGRHEGREGAPDPLRHGRRAEHAVGRPELRQDTLPQVLCRVCGKPVPRGAIVPIIASLLVISVYIALRFEWKYAVPVLIALMHDLLITSGVYSLPGREVTASTVAALLTILGYSLYDTIIVFD